MTCRNVGSIVFALAAPTLTGSPHRTLDLGDGYRFELLRASKTETLARARDAAADQRRMQNASVGLAAAYQFT